jgi:proton-dependent oligopeptide transporter, POT family
LAIVPANRFSKRLNFVPGEQQGNAIALWADDDTDRTIDLIFWHGEIPVTWFQAFNPFMIFTFTPLIVTFWTWQAEHGKEPSTVREMALGCFGVALSYLIMAGAAWSAGGNSASWRWLLAYFVVITSGELNLSPIGLSLVSKIAPTRMISTMMGLWLDRQFRRRLARQFLGLHGQGKLLRHDRRYRGERRRGDLVLQKTAS